MDGKEKKEDVAVKRSEEVQDIIDRMPTRWTAWVVLIISVLIAVLSILSFLIKYPDTVSGQISVSASKAPVRLVANSNGRLHLLKQNRSKVAKGDVIGYIESGADYDDVCRMSELLEGDLSPSSVMALPHHLKLGELSADYNSFVLAYKQYDLLRRTTVYDNMRSSLYKQISAARRLAENINVELELSDKSLKNINERYLKDSILSLDGAISDEELKSRHNSYLSALQNNVGMKSSQLSKMAEIEQNETEIAKIDVTESESLKKSYMDLLAKRNVLKDNVSRWFETYVVTSPISGKIEYLGFWRENVFVTSSKELFSIIPHKSTPVGEVYIPVSGAGKVRVGQDVDVRISDFPYNEYGYVKGRVKTISEIPNKYQTNEGMLETYLVIVDFPEGLITNFGKELIVNFEAKGVANVITKPKRLIQRLFDNLKAKENK